MIITNTQIAEALEEAAPLELQEQWDNSGWQLGLPDAVCTGVLICVDASEAVVDEAVKLGVNMIITHHPLIFRPLHKIMPVCGRVDATVWRAIQNGLSVYSAHTSVDNAPNGVSWQLASDLGLKDIQPLLPGVRSESGTGAVGNLEPSMSALEFAAHVKSVLGSGAVRCTDPSKAPSRIARVALCGGSGAEFLPQAKAAGAQAYVTSDTKHNQFIDHTDDIFLVDTGHYESENCTKRIFYHILTQKFPNFAVHISQSETNPIVYL